MTASPVSAHRTSQIYDCKIKNWFKEEIHVDLLDQDEKVLALNVSNYDFTLGNQSCPFSFRFQIKLKETENDYSMMVKISENVAMMIREYAERKYYYYGAVRRNRSMTFEEKRRHDNSTHMSHAYSSIIDKLSSLHQVEVDIEVESIDNYLDHIINDLITRETNNSNEENFGQ